MKANDVLMKDDVHLVGDVARRGIVETASQSVGWTAHEDTTEGFGIQLFAVVV
jgi:hypothetical protein